MNLITQITQLPVIDYAAVLFLIASWALISWRIEHPSMGRPSVSMLMAERRREWMKVFVGRVPRIFDSQILASLRQGTAFFASTSLFAIGGILAMMGNTEPLRDVAEQFTNAKTPLLVWQLKLGLVALLLVNAFLKFVWASRVFGYCAVLMGSVPNEPDDPMAFPRAAQAAELNVRAALNFNRGLRSLYFALGALAWLIGGIALIVATCIVIWVVWSREFASLPRTIILGETE